MNQIRTFAFVAAALLFGVALPAAAQSAKSLVGAWTLVSAGDTYGPNPKGSLIFDAHGRYSLNIMRADLPKFASNSRVKGTTDENKAIVAGSITHFGRYSVSEPDKTLTLNIESSTFPNWNGTVQKRPFTIAGDELKYTVAAPSAGTGPTGNPVVWRRAK